MTVVTTVVMIRYATVITTPTRLKPLNIADFYHHSQTINA